MRSRTIDHFHCGWYRRSCERTAAGGFSMLEFMVALVVFTVTVAGVRSAQLIARQSNNDALRFTQATASAREMLSLVQANSRQLSVYLNEGASWTGELEGLNLAPPCGSRACSAQEIASYDIAQWRSDLSGAAIEVNGKSSPMLPEVFSCIGRHGGTIVTGVGWRSAVTESQAPRPDCVPQNSAAVNAKSLTDSWTLARVSALVSQ